MPGDGLRDLLRQPPTGPVRRAGERRWQPGAGIALGRVELGLGEEQAAGEVGAPQVGASEVGSREVGQAEVGAGEVGADEAGPAQIGALEIGAGRRPGSWARASSLARSSKALTWARCRPVSSPRRASAGPFVMASVAAKASRSRSWTARAGRSSSAAARYHSSS